MKAPILCGGLGLRGEFGAYLQAGFWKNMDIYKDYMSLSSLNLAERMRRR